MCYFQTGQAPIGSPKAPSTGGWGTNGSAGPLSPSSPTSPSPASEKATQVSPDSLNPLAMGYLPLNTTKKSSVAPSPTPLGTFALRLSGNPWDSQALKNPFKIGP